MEQNQNQTTRRRNRNRNRNRGTQLQAVPNEAEPGTTFLTPVPNGPVSNVRFPRAPRQNNNAPVAQTRRRDNRNRQRQQNQNQNQQQNQPQQNQQQNQPQQNQNQQQNQLQQNQQQNQLQQNQQQRQNQNQRRNRRRNRNRQQRPPSIFWDLQNYLTFENPTDQVAQNRIQEILNNIQNNRYPDINDTDETGNTPLMIASVMTELHNGIIQAIIDHGNARIGATNDDGETALILAAINVMEQNALYLVETGEANIEQVDNTGNDALFYAIENDLYYLMIKIQEILGDGDEDEQPIVPNYDPNRNLIDEILSVRTNPANAARVIEGIQSGLLNPGEISTAFHKMTPLMIAIDLGFDDIAEKLIQTDINLNNVDDYGNTALIYAAQYRLLNICDILIDKNANVGQINNDGENAMLFLIKGYGLDFNVDVINQLLLKLAETGQADSGQTRDLDNRNSIYYIERNITDNDLKERLKELIKNTRPTPFMSLSIINKMRKIQILESVLRSPGGPTIEQDIRRFQATIDNCKDNVRVNIVNNNFDKDELTPTNKNTILMESILLNAIRHSVIPNVLINSGNHKPNEVNRQGKTALIMACENNLPEIALRLLTAGNANENQVDRQGHNALYYAQNAAVDFTEVINRLNSINGFENLVRETQERQQQPPPNFNININETAFNIITQERETIRDFLASSNDNIVINVDGTNYFTSKTNIRSLVNDNINNKYGCKQAGDQMRFQLDNNIYFNPVYFSLSTITASQVVVRRNEIENLLANSHNLYVCYSTNKILPAIMSVAYHQGTTSGISADHCQSGKATPVYTISRATPIDEPIEEQEAQVAQEVPQEQTIKVQYKGVTYTFPVTFETTLSDLKDMLLNKLVQENQIQTNNYNVKFIYTGKIYKDNDLNKQLTQLANPPFGITLQSMVSPISGGKRRKTKKRNNKKRKLTKRI